jgi:nucleoside-diphosphate-sugar epimerase
LLKLLPMLWESSRPGVEFHCLSRAVAMVGELLPRRLKRLAPPTQSRLDFLTHNTDYDVSRATRLLDFTAKTELDTGIR